MTSTFTKIANWDFVATGVIRVSQTHIVAFRAHEPKVQVSSAVKDKLTSTGVWTATATA